MALFTEYGQTDNDPGTWAPYARDEAKGVVVEFLVSAIADTIERQIRSKYKALRESKLQLVKGGKTEMPLAVDAERDAAIDRATLALRDSKNFDGVAGDAEAAATYTELLGEHVEVGKPFTFDGKLRTNEKLRRHLVTHYDALRVFIIDQIAKAKMKQAEEEDALSGN
jgi:hypothetical protein